MATIANASLNAESADPTERQSNNLPPKSYADAVENEPPVGNANGINGTKDMNGATGNGEQASAKVNGSSNGHTASVLRIVDTESKKEEEKSEEKRNSSNEATTKEYSATGLDDRPRTPIRHKHRKSSSKSSSGSQEHMDAGDSPTKKSSLGSFVNEKADVKDSNDHTTVFKKVDQNQKNELISVKPVSEYEKEKRTDKRQTKKPRKEEKITSGRKAGQRWEKSAIRWAPLNVPLQRRLQTLVVLCHTLCIAICVSFFFFLCAIPLFWPLLIPYMVYTMTSKASTSGTLSHRSEFLRSSPVWSLFASYFPARLHRSQELPPTRKYIFGYHPHGIISLGAFGAFATEALGFSQLFPGIRNTLLTLDSNFRIPVYRDYALAMGISSVSRESCENLLSKGGSNKEGMGRAITIVIGGARESLDAQPHSLRLVLKRRKGFVKMAIRTGADLVPVLGFGENDLFDQLAPNEHPKIHRFQLLVKKVLGFTIPLFHARGIFNYDVGLMPYRRPLNIVVGKPIKVVQNTKPEQDEIDRVHEEYVQELERIWNTWKDEFSPDRKEELQFVE